MSVAYVDTSWLIAIAFGEPTAKTLLKRLRSFDVVISANILVAEFRAAHLRERAQVDDDLLALVSWVLPDRNLEPEVSRVLDHGYVRGADCWHLAVALYVASDPADLTFLSIDRPQTQIARTLGFATTRIES